ncbi:MAG: hypothetical protein J6D03_05910 [Clostridia bacterium]|nr:hypothetical protein [Clostridia bacterium]
MKTLQQFTEGKNRGINLDGDNTVNYLEVGELQQYLKVANKFLSEDAIYVINWLIENNSTYINKFGGSNALQTFYNKGIPADGSLRELYACIGRLNKENRILEIPVFLSKEQFDAIINKTINLDDILLDLTSERGREAVIKRYNPLLWKIVRSFAGKSSLTIDELYSVGLEGLTWAINSYGQKSNKRKRLEDRLGMDVTDHVAVKSMTFLSFAGFMIKCAIFEAIKNESHTVRIPVSDQNRERIETGRNTKRNAISGDKPIAGDNSGAKTLFDYVDSGEKEGQTIDDEDIKKIWAMIYDKLDKKFDKKSMEIFYAATGLNGYKKMKKKDIAKKYNIASSSVTMILYRVRCFLLSDEKMKNLMLDVRELMWESSNAASSSLMTETHYIK